MGGGEEASKFAHNSDGDNQTIRELRKQQPMKRLETTGADYHSSELLMCKMFNGKNTAEKLKFKLLLFNLVTNDKYFAWCF